MRTHRLTAAILAAGTLAVAACSSSSSSSGPAATSAASSLAASPSASAAQPQTAAAAKSVARQYLGLYAAGQYTTSWALLAPSAQKAVPEAVWMGVHQASPSPGLAYSVKDVTLADSTAVVTVTLAGAASGLASASEAFTYSGGRWGFAPNDLSLYEHGSVKAYIAPAKAAGDCASG